MLMRDCNVFCMVREERRSIIGVMQWVLIPDDTNPSDASDLGVKLGPGPGEPPKGGQAPSQTTAPNSASLLTELPILPGFSFSFSPTSCPSLQPSTNMESPQMWWMNLRSSTCTADGMSPLLTLPVVNHCTCFVSLLPLGELGVPLSTSVYCEFLER